MAERYGVVVVTGASRGLGVSIVRDLARSADHLVLAARDAAGLEAVAAEVRAAGAKATTVVCDVTSAADRARLVAAAEAAGPVDVLVNNAGIEIAVAIVDQSAAEIDQQVAVNLLAPIHLTRAFLPGMIARKRGVVVMISSMSAKAPIPYNAVYAATKYGMNGFTASVRIEIEGSGVHLGAVCPGFIAEAGMWSDTGVKAPSMMREVSHAQVVAGVRRVLGGASEVLVTRMPVRPMLALGQFFPNIDGPVLKTMGVLDALKERARVILESRKA